MFRACALFCSHIVSPLLVRYYPHVLSISRNRLAPPHSSESLHRMFYPSVFKVLTFSISSRVRLFFFCVISVYRFLLLVEFQIPHPVSGFICKSCSVLFLFMCIVVSPVTPPPLVFSLVSLCCLFMLFLTSWYWPCFLCSRPLLSSLLFMYLALSDTCASTPACLSLIIGFPLINHLFSTHCASGSSLPHNT